MREVPRYGQRKDMVRKPAGQDALVSLSLILALSLSGGAKTCESGGLWLRGFRVQGLGYRVQGLGFMV